MLEPSPDAGAPGPLRAVTSARTLAFGPVGIVARTLPETAAYQALLDAPADRDAVSAAMPEATPAGRLFLAHLLDAWFGAGPTVFAALAEDDGVVTTASGCTIARTTVSAYARPRRGPGVDRLPRGRVDEAARAPAFGAALRALRERARWSPADLAAAAGVAADAVAAWEDGVPPLPDPGTVRAVERALRERVFFGLGLLELAARRHVLVGPDPLAVCPAYVNAACPEVAALLDLATAAGVPVVGSGATRDGVVTVRLGAPLPAAALPEGLAARPTGEPSDTRYGCDRHGHEVRCEPPPR